MTVIEPKPQEFGVTAEQYAVYRGADPEFDWGAGSLLFVALSMLSVTAVVFFLAYRDGMFTAVVASIFAGLVSYVPASIVLGFIYFAITPLRKARLLKSPVASRIRLYEEARAKYLSAMEEAERERREAERREWEAAQARREAERARRQKQIRHWMLLNGRDFEHEMAALCRRLGYRVEITPTSGDEGVDLVLRDHRGKKIVVQCKSHKKPVGPATVRELYGSMVAAKADKALLACTGGFTKGVRDFAKGKPIMLVSASGLVRLAKKAASGASNNND